VTAHQVEAGGPPPLRFGGRSLPEELSAAAPKLVRAILPRLTHEIPEFAALPAEELAGEIARAADRALRCSIGVFESGRFPGPDELIEIRHSAARRAEEGIPLDIVLAAYHLGTRVVLEHITRDAGPDDAKDLARLSLLTVGYLARLSTAVSGGYMDEYRMISGAAHAAEQQLLDALLDGVPAASAAERAGVTLPAGFFVVSLAVGVHPDERRAGVDPSIAARRKLRRLRGELDRRVRDTVLCSLSPEGGVALVPTAKAGDEVDPDDWAGLATTVAALQRAAEADIIAGAVAADATDVSRAAPVAREVLDVARRSGRPPGLYRLEDVLLEYQLSRPSAARRELAALVAPLKDRAELLATARAYLGTGLNRRRTALVLHIHPNTVDNRLRRIASLTGLDPTDVTGQLRLAAALTAYDASS
jgi:hypothetical protein